MDLGGLVRRSRGVQWVLWAGDNVVGLGVARVVLGWPFVLLVIAASWWVIRRSLPGGHPGLLHPRAPAGTTPDPARFWQDASGGP